MLLLYSCADWNVYNKVSISNLYKTVWICSNKCICLFNYMNCLEIFFFSKCLNGARVWVIQRSDETNTTIAIRQVWCLVCVCGCLFCFVCYEACPEFWISREPDAWPWCNLATSQRRPYFLSVKGHSLVGLVNRQWDAVDLSRVLCDRRIHDDRGSR